MYCFSRSTWNTAKQRWYKAYLKKTEKWEWLQNTAGSRDILHFLSSPGTALALPAYLTDWLQHPPAAVPQVPPAFTSTSRRAQFPSGIPTKVSHATLGCSVNTPCRELTSSPALSLMLCASPRAQGSQLSWRTPLLAHAWLSATQKNLYFSL